MAVIIGRRVNGITINPLEYLLELNTERPKMFNDTKEAEKFLQGVDPGVNVDFFEFVEVENCVCGRCGWPVVKSIVDGYSYTCINDDEDLYSFEVKNIGELK